MTTPEKILKEIKQEAIMEESIASAELAGAQTGKSARDLAHESENEIAKENVEAALLRL